MRHRIKSQGFRMTGFVCSAGTAVIVLAMTRGCGEQIPSLPETGAAPFFTLGNYTDYTFFDCDIPIDVEAGLLNYSADAGSPDAPFDPERPSIVLVHGYNIQANLWGCGGYAWPRTMGQAMARRVGDLANIAVFQHDKLATVSLDAYVAGLEAIGDVLVAKLREAGLTRELQLIGHSGGVLPVLRAMDGLGYIKQATILDGSPWVTQQIEADAAFFEKVGYVELYHVPLPGDLGGNLPPSPQCSITYMYTEFADSQEFLPMHFAPVVWYLKTIEHPEAPGGFNLSFVDGTWEYLGRRCVVVDSFLYVEEADGTYVPAWE